MRIRSSMGVSALFLLRKRHLLLLGVALVIFFCALLLKAPAWPAFRPAAEDGPLYVIDAGHGGEDGGAVTATGDKESEINLAVAERLDALLVLLGRRTKMTRTDDVSVYSDGAETLRQKKASDLRNRVAMVNAEPDAVLVSIHQNSLPQAPSVRGAQVFYGAEPAGQELALSVQTALNAAVNANPKQAKRIDDSIYLMRHTERPALLIECGFLSNAEEAARLKTPEHQKRLSAAIAAGLLAENTEDLAGEQE